MRGRGRERWGETSSLPVYVWLCWKKQSPSIIIPHLPFMNMCTDCHCVAWIKAQGYNRSFGLWTLLAGQNNYKWSGVAFFLCYSVGAAWFLSKLKGKRDWGEGWERERGRERQRDRVDLSWMNVLRMPLINARTHSQTRAATCTLL